MRLFYLFYIWKINFFEIKLLSVTQTEIGCAKGNIAQNFTI